MHGVDPARGPCFEVTRVDAARHGVDPVHKQERRQTPTAANSCEATTHGVDPASEPLAVLEVQHVL